MKLGEKGFTLLELLVSLAIIPLVALSASATMFQISKSTDRNRDYMTAVRQVQNAGYWISRDAQMANSITTNTTLPDFLTIGWTEWNWPSGAIYHYDRYFFEGLTSEGIGTLKRNHLSSAGENQTTLIATGIYYESTDNNTSKASYQSPVLTVQLTAVSGKTRETREYKIKRRPNL